MTPTMRQGSRERRGGSRRGEGWVLSLLAAAILTFGGSAAPGARGQSGGPRAAETLFRRAESLQERGQFARAKMLFRQVVDRYPDTIWAGKAEYRGADDAVLRLKPLAQSGPPENRIDLVITGDGFLINEQKDLEKAAKSCVEALFREPTLQAYRPLWNVWLLNVASAENQISGFGQEYDTALGVRFNPMGSGQLEVDFGAVHDVLEEQDVNDGLAIVIGSRGNFGTGREGIAVVGPKPGITIVHEMGHALAGLGDEFLSEGGGRGIFVPDGPNLSRTDDPARVPWRRFLEARVEGVGIYEGGGGVAKGTWRPTTGGCAMETGSAFCPVCREAMILTMWQFADPIESAEPAEEFVSIRGQDTATFSVTPIPGLRGLVATFRLVRIEDEAAATPEDPVVDIWPEADRGGRWRVGSGPLDRPEGGTELIPAVSRRRRGSSYHVTVRAQDLEPGDYELWAEVRDSTPSVLEDPEGLLTGVRLWRIERDIFDF